MVSYFTIAHIITLVLFFLLFLILLVLSFKETRKKVLYAMIFSNFLVISMLALFSMFVLDKYTKKAVLEHVTHARILINESLVISGIVRNVGKFNISQCSIVVKLVNNAVNSNNLTGSTLYKSSGLDFFTNKAENQQQSTITEDFVIAKNLRVKEFRNFSVSMHYPAYFKKPNLIYKLRCR
ncbi:DUF2393 family protein [Sulfurospirillum sp. 1612]|uniref:DUF2393 family protein n=1 Tax=Sulfurospirillum sp. 1612 TaxID=3094835 RepID=UPI002F91D713